MVERAAADDALVLTGAVPSRTQTRIALGVVPGLLLALFAVTRPFAGLQLASLPMFVPMETSALFVVDLITAVILFMQASILRSLCAL